MDATKKVDVFISGAGPVGLFFAYQMAKRGHSIYICDFKAGPTLESRACSVTARTLEIFEARGLVDDFIAESFAAKGIKVWRNGRMLGQLDYYGGETAYGQLTIISQSNTESILNRRLELDTEYRVQWETELVSFVQDKEKVIATVRDKKTGKEQTIESTYIVGADGSRSKVRKEDKDWTFDGMADKTQFALADVELTGEGIEEFNDRLNLLSAGTEVFGMVRLNPLPHEEVEDFHTFRIFGNLTTMERPTKSNGEEVSHGFVDKDKNAPTLTQDYIQAWLKKFTSPYKLTVNKVLWISEFRVNERIVNGYRRGRAFLVGDAAHCHSPAGGYGLSLGLQDADNLVWKMSDTLKGIARDPEKLLDSYNLERMPIAQATIKETRSTSSASFGKSDIVGYIISFAIFVTLKLPMVRNAAFNRAMQLNVAVDPKSSTIMGKFDKKLLIKPGQFLPNHDPLRKTFYFSNTSKSNRSIIERQTLRDILVLTKQTTVVYIGTRYPNAASNEDIIEKLWTSTRSLPVKRLVVQSNWSCALARYPAYIREDEKELAQDSFYNEERIDTPQSLTKQVGLFPWLSSMFSTVKNPPGVILVVRPDFYISQAQLVHDERDLASMVEYLSTIFVKTNDSSL